MSLVQKWQEEENNPLSFAVKIYTDQTPLSGGVFYFIDMLFS